MQHLSSLFTNQKSCVGSSVAKGAVGTPPSKAAGFRATGCLMPILASPDAYSSARQDAETTARWTVWPPPMMGQASRDSVRHDPDRNQGHNGRHAASHPQVDRTFYSRPAPVRRPPPCFSWRRRIPCFIGTPAPRAPRPIAREPRGGRRDGRGASGGNDGLERMMRHCGHSEAARQTDARKAPPPPSPILRLHLWR